MGRRLTQLDRIPVTELSGVGPKKADGLREMGIETVLDLLLHYPRRYIDRTNEALIKDLPVGTEGMVLATVKRSSSRRTRQGRVMVQVDVTDGSGYLRCTFFNQAWREKQLKPGTQGVFFGKLETFQGRKQMTNPVVDLVGDRTGRIVPIYPQSEKAQLTTCSSVDSGTWMPRTAASRVTRSHRSSTASGTGSSSSPARRSASSTQPPISHVVSWAFSDWG